MVVHTIFKLILPCTNSVADAPLNKWRILIGLATGLFMASLEGTIVPVAMPRAVLELGGQQLYNWPITIFIFASTISIPVWGRLSDLYGRRIIYTTGLALFMVASLLCGISWSMEALILFRLLQGMGSGAVFSLTFTIIGDLFTLEERGRVTGYTSTVWAVGSILGPPMGGVIVDTLGWRWIYLVNVPPALVALSMGAKGLRGLATWQRGRRLDAKGFILFTIISTCLLLLIDAPMLDWQATSMTVLVVLVATPLFIRVERIEKMPFIPFRLLSDRLNFTLLAINGVVGFAFFGIVTIVPPILQWFYGLPPTTAGLLMASSTLGWVLAANISSRLIVRYGPGPMIKAGVSLFVVAVTLLLVTNTFAPSPWLLIPPLVMVGTSMGLTVPTTLITIQTLASSAELGFLTSILTFFRSFGGSLGSQAMWAPFANTPIELGILSAIFYPTIYSFGIALVLSIINIPLAFRIEWPDLRMIEIQRRNNQELPDNSL
ncbi:Multidrug resistance protein 3 [Candidatus Calditenuaceae archaeon HR02]|nr:Multidrug resistance protein 3 [Candidatus Calditenuaceae archaeon HR02]